MNTVRGRGVPVRSTTLNVGLIAALGGIFTGLGIWAAVGSGSFSRTLADFGPRNDHLVHDFGAASIAIGVGEAVLLIGGTVLLGHLAAVGRENR